GVLNATALQWALDQIVARHEALRTTFVAGDGEPTQQIAPAETSGCALTFHDLEGWPDAAAALTTLVASEAREPFDLTRGPLIRGRLIRLGAAEHALVITLHHIVADGWSMGVLTRELSALYAAAQRGAPAALAPLPIQYADYAQWQRQWVEGPELQRQAAYWR